MPTQTERKTRTRAALLAAGQDRFGAVGFDHVTIDELASTAGVTSGAVYHHFTNKEALFEAVFNNVEEDLALLVAGAAQQLSSHTSNLLAGCYAYVRFASVPSTARIVLVDAPVVLSLSKYRSIDEHYFLPMLIAEVEALRPNDSGQSIAILSRAIFAALCELALLTYLHPETLNEVDDSIRILVGNLG